MEDSITQETKTNPIRYLEDLKKLEIVHPSIKQKFNEYVRVLEESKIHKIQIINNIDHHYNQINHEMEELKDVYSGIDILSTHLPNYEREQKNWNTLQHNEISVLVSAIKDIIKLANDIKVKIVEKPVVQKQEGKTEQEKVAFENVQKEYLIAMKNATSKAEYNIIRNQLRAMVNTEEEKVLTNNLSLEIFGKRMEELEWEIKRKTPRKDAKNAVQK